MPIQIGVIMRWNKVRRGTYRIKLKFAFFPTTIRVNNILDENSEKEEVVIWLEKYVSHQKYVDFGLGPMWLEVDKVPNDGRMS